MTLILCALPALSLAGSGSYDLGLQLVNAQKYQAAIAEFLKVPADSPDAARAACQLGVCYKRLSKLDEALEACSNGLSLAVNSEDRAALIGLLKDVRFAVASSLANAEAWDEAIAALASLAAEYPEEGGWQLAVCYMTKGDYDKAEKQLTELLDRYPASAMAAEYDVRIAKCLFLQDRRDEAFARLASVITKYPKEPGLVMDMVYTLASSLERRGLPQEATARYEQLIAANPNDLAVVGLKFGVALQLLHWGRCTEARDTLTALYADYPVGRWHNMVKYTLGDCLVRLGEYQTARQVYQEVIRDFPGSPGARGAVHQLETLRSKASGGGIGQ